MDKIKTFMQGFMVGFGKIMPGVSGSVMAICFGIYERMIAAFSSLKAMKKDLKFMLTLGVGIILAIILGSNIIKALMVDYYVPTMMVFIGMMIPGLFPILKEVKNTDLTPGRVAICLLVLFFLFYLNVLGTTSHSTGSTDYLREFISLTLCGIVDAATTIIPGISGSALLMLFGYYDAIIGSLANIFSLKSLLVLLPFFIGMIAGVILTSKLVTYLFKHYRVITYMIVIVFASFSILAIVFKLLETVGITEFLKYSIFTIIGSLVTYLTTKIMGES